MRLWRRAKAGKITGSPAGLLGRRTRGKTAHGSYVVGRFEIFLNVGFWAWGMIPVGKTRLYRFGLARVWVEPR